jgi:uridine kinase
MNQSTMQGRIRVRLPDGTEVERSAGIPVRDLLPGSRSPEGLSYLAALVNNDLCSLSYPLTVNSELRFLTFAGRHGARVYRHSLTFLLARAIHDLYPASDFSVEHSLGSGYFCRFRRNSHVGSSAAEVEAIEARMRELVRQDLPIQRRSISFEDACSDLEREEQADKLNLLRFRNPPRIVMYACGEFSDLGHSVLAASTGALDTFRLLRHETGLVLQFPVMRDGRIELAPFEDQPELFRIFQERKRWGKIIGIRTVGDLNETVAEHHLRGLIQISEALQEKKLGQIADAIDARREKVKWVLIAGPSSSGKTTFSRRLAVHLRVNGLRPVNIECDNYFRNREDTPKDSDGNYDFEHLQAIDLELLHEHLRALDSGEEIELPHFDFHAGRQRPSGRRLRLEEDQVVILEGIHGLNPELTSTIPACHKYRIYVSALTQLQVDRNNRVSTTDLRLIRRLVRDNIFRGNNALRTLRMWPNVRRGEKRWVFPFQQKIDVAFNSSLDYELAVLRIFVEPLLSEVKPRHPEYAEARRLQGFLQLVLSAGASDVPPNSLLREFIGGSIFASAPGV